MRKSCIAILVFVFAVAGSAHAACPSFVNSGAYGLSDYLHDSAAGDFNNDGRMDIVGVNGSKTDVLLQNEDGSFSRSSITAGSPWGVAVGDLNRDGKLDIVYTNFSLSTYSILIGHGDGTFDAPVNTSVAFWAVDAVVGDFDRDGIPDLAITAENPNGVAIALGSSATPGTFGAATRYPIDATPYPNSQPTSLVAADFNGDGKLDVAVEDTLRVWVMSGDGAGALGAGVRDPNVTWNDNPRSLVSGDFNRDGRADLAVTLWSNNQVAVLLNNGSGAFPAKTAYGTGDFPYAATVLDANGDGNADIATSNTNSGSLSILLGNGAGSFAPKKDFPLPTGRTLVAADFNRDGRDDIGVGQYPAAAEAILLNNGTCYSHCGTFGSAATYGAAANEVTLGDLNGDGKLDIVETLSGSNAIEVLLGNGLGAFLPGPSVTTAVGTTPLGVATGDLNRDGKLDVVVANSGAENLSVLLGLGNGDFSAASSATLAVGNKPRNVVVGDFNRDGRLDLAAASNTAALVGRVTIFLQNGAGAFAASPAIAVGTDVRQIMTADFNHDGILDLATANFGSDNVSVLLGTGTGTFGAATNVDTVAGPSGLAVGDYNADGSPDLVVADSGVNGLTLLLNNGSGVFSLEYTHSLDVSVNAVAPADINRDGLLDVALVNSSDFTITIALGNGDGTFQYPGNLVFAVASAPGFVATGDLNSNGTQDLVVATDANVSVLLNSCPTADLSITKTHVGTISQGQNGATFTLTVTNVGGAGTTGMVTVTDLLPPGVTVTDISSAGPQFFCNVDDASCSTPFPLGAGQSYPAITITADIASDAPNNLVNAAKVVFSGDPNQDNDIATDPLDVQPAADLTIAMTHTPTTFTQKTSGSYYTITVTNQGSIPTSGQVSVFDQPLGGLTITAISGVNWTCTLASVTCTRTDALAPASSYEVITVTVDVAPDAPPQVTNTAEVSGGGDNSINNDTVFDNTIVDQLADLTVFKSHNGNFRQGEKGATFTIVVSNFGGQPTSGEVTVSESPDPAFTIKTMSGTGWTCTLNNPFFQCTRSDVLNSGENYPDVTVTVDVSPTAAAQVTNNVGVSGGNEGNENNNGYSDPVDIDQLTDLTIEKTHSGSFIQGDTGYQYQIVVSNNGGIASTGQVTMTDSLPAGLTATNIAGTGWNCNVPNATCTRSDSLAGGASYPPIILTVSVASNAPASVINTATVSGGGDAYAPNNTAQDPTTVNPSAGVIAPTNLVATAISVNEVQITWNAVTNAQVYTVYVNGVPIVPSTASTSYTDTVFAGNTYVYFVTASNGGTTSGPSNKDIATTIFFTDDPIIGGTTRVKAVHIVEMRNAVNAVRTVAGLGAYPFTGTPAAGGTIRAQDILELRSALNQARSVIGVPAVQYSNPTLGIGSAVRAADAQEIRNGTK